MSETYGDAKLREEREEVNRLRTALAAALEREADARLRYETAMSELQSVVEPLEARVKQLVEALEEIEENEPDEKPDGTILGYLVHDQYEMAAIARAALLRSRGENG